MSATEIRDAKEICERCPVQDACLAYALGNADDWGVWGGTTGPERRRMRARSA